ncbi:hypothetical protein [Sphingomonas echinoides]|uniref:hypothetical protein n=1 Tax=Sphingomonas echinoides TaxID=59803 RepID=UPI0024134F65|nr:hypothetical protein [Sphingomonas echinoides]
MPADFPEMFVLLGHKTIEYHYCAGIGTIKRWMREYGEADLIQVRRGYLRKLYASKGSRTAAGSKPGVRFGGFPEMAAGNPALAMMPVRQARRIWQDEIWVPVNGGKPKPDEFAAGF